MTPSSRIPALLRHYFLYKMTFLCIVFKDREVENLKVFKSALPTSSVRTSFLARCPVVACSAVRVAVVATTLMIIAKTPQTVNPIFCKFSIS